MKDLELILNMQTKYLTPIRLAIISPCYNEGNLITDSSTRLSRVINELIQEKTISKDSFILFVNDGSTDNTWNELSRINKIDHKVCALNLSKNVGHQIALMCGMMYVRKYVDAIITIDSDLQDDISAIEKMIEKHYDGAEIVYGIKKNRSVDPFFKRTFSSLFYNVQKLLGIKVIRNHADFRLLSQKVLNSLASYHERDIYLRGIIPLLGFNSVEVDDFLNPRLSGNSKYSISKQIHLAIDGITSFSSKPLEWIFIVGIIMMALSICMLVYVIVSFFLGNVIAGWASLMISIWFIGAVLVMSIGLIGIYIGKIFMEVKHRPLYRVSETIGLNAFIEKSKDICN